MPKTKNTQNTTVSFWNSVKTKLIAVMMIICIVPMAISLTISTENSVAQAVKDAQEKGLQRAQIVENEFQTIFLQNVRVMEAISHSREIKDFILDSDHKDLDRIQQYLITLNEHLRDGNDIIVEEASGQQLVRTSGTLVNVADREFFQEALTGKEVISDVLISKSTGLKVVILAIPIKDLENNKVIGVVQKSYDLSFLHEFLAGTVDEAAKEESFILDREGNLIAHSGYELKPEDEAPNYSNLPFFSDQKTDGNYITQFEGKKSLMGFQKEEQTGWIVVSAVDYNKTIASAKRSANLTVVIGIIMLIIAIGISLTMANSFTKPLHLLNACMSLLAVGSFRQIEQYTGRKDEFGEIIRNTNSVIDKLSGIIQNIKNSTAAVNNSSEDVAETANQISQASESVATAVQDISSGAAQQASEIDEVTENVNRISEANQKVQSNTQTLTSLASDMQKESSVSSENLTSLQHSSEKMSESILQIAEKVGATSVAVENINSKVEEIASIANQTNLLSLNASIEAARAGEAGRGFAVVAEEISTLADNSKNLASVIRSEMDILLSKSSSAVEMSDAVRKENERQQDIISSTVQSVKDMIDDISSTAASARSIETEVDGCINANGVVSNAMSSLSSVSQENAGSAENTGASVEELFATATTLAESADALKEISDQLNHEMAFFR
ncbi:methyl-accepting chemotaxis protein [Lachnospiraceae bacterium C10]|nr:methyl-accepting chemotaxis protein [Lachnospiraceae bacterium C10]